MKLKKFERTSLNIKDGLPSISIYGKIGRIMLSPTAVERLGLAIGDGICFYQDEDSPADWFIKKDSDDYPFILKRNKNTLVFSCVKLARKMLASMLGGVHEKETCRFMVSGSPYKDGYHAIVNLGKKRQNG